MLLSNVVLTGPMGTGKSTIGKLLSKKLNCKFYDIDNELENFCGCKIYEVFLLEGESSFRKREHKIIKDLVKKNGIVLSTGGGSIMNSKNIPLLRNKCIIIYLYTSISNQINRLDNTTDRPLLKRNKVNKSIYNIFKNRERIYHYLADIIINTENKLDLIIKEIKKRIVFFENH
ncbi:shikimate kinase [Candidatus Portiera aleyrodidarum]|uniref:shikimate kinase n=1 Tax=Candidatus Portiera aleyrodidarum TaxID=91844 RepID=UPI000C78E6A0|nr:shikimate kinase [Candidatus Portiera aleyrodidarum]AUI73044.1 shikimate kinase [Candidatus Portiera aleyrodidarum]